MKTMNWKAGTLPRTAVDGTGAVNTIPFGGPASLDGLGVRSDRLGYGGEPTERASVAGAQGRQSGEVSGATGGSPIAGAAVEVALQHDTPPADARHLVFLSDPDSPRAASYRILRQRLKDRGDPRVMVVTSASRGEGKTTCSINLAMALAEHGRARVLLLEANIRHPRLAMALGFSPPGCLAEQLASRWNHPEAPWKVAACFSPQLHVLAMEADAGGKWLLNGFALGAAIEQLRGEYDYVIIDASSTLGSADVNVIQDATDGVLFAARSAKTSGADLRRAVQQLAPADILGVVLIDT